MRPLFYLARYRRSKLILYLTLFVVLAAIIFIVVSVTNIFGLGLEAGSGFQWPATQNFPSAKVAYYMFNDPYPPEGRDAYAAWFAKNYDLNMSISDSDSQYIKSLNPDFRSTSYRWYNSLAPFEGLAGYDANLALLEYTFLNNINQEDWYIHYQKNTPLANWSASTFIDDRFHYVYIDSVKKTTPAYEDGNTEAFGQTAGSFLYIGNNFKFKEINFTFATPASADWQGEWQYWNGSSWTRLNLTSDTTNNLTQNGKVEFWQPPRDWQRVGNVNGTKPVYWVRLSTINPGSTKPVAKTIRNQKYYENKQFTYVDNNGVTQTITRMVVPGWDPTQDQGQNGGVANDGIRDTAPDSMGSLTGTSALIKGQSRAITTGVPVYSVNLRNPALRDWLEGYFVSQLGSSIDGIHYDGNDTDASQYFGYPIDPSKPTSILKNGVIAEYSGDAQASFALDNVAIAAETKTKLGSKMLAANTVRESGLDFERALDVCNREDFYGLFGHKSSSDLEGRTGYWKILTSDSNFRVVGKEGKRNILNFIYSFRYKDSAEYNNVISSYLSSNISANETSVLLVANSQIFPSSGTVWLEDEKISYSYKTATSLNGLQRGVDGTVAIAHNAGTLSRVIPSYEFDREKMHALSLFYIVQNPATDYFFPYRDWGYGGRQYYVNTHEEAKVYLPGAVKYDIGQPTNQIPTGFSALPNNDWQVFVAASGSDFKIYGREYSKAIVLVKPLSSSGLGDASKTTVQLPVTTDNPSGKYYRLNEDGSLDTTAISSINLKSVEGTILVKESALTGIALTKSVSKSSAASGETITYTINYQVGNQAVTSAKIEDPIPSGTSFVSAANGGTSNGTTITWNLGNLAIGAKGSVSFQVKIQ